MTDARLESMLRDAILEEPSGAVDSAVTAAIRREAARGRSRALTFRWTRRVAAVVAIVALASFPIHRHNSREAGDDAIGDGEIMLEIIGLSSPDDFYAEE